MQSHPAGTRPAAARLVLAAVMLGAALVASAFFPTHPGDPGRPSPASALFAPPVAYADSEATITLGATAASQRFVVQAQRPETADRTLRYAETAFATLAPHFRRLPRGPIIVVVVEDRAEYERIEPAPETRGFATFGGNRVYLLGNQLDQEVVTHELTHIFLGKNVRPGLHLPDWFNEGLAQYASGAKRPDLELIYSLGAGGILPLAELDAVDALKSPDRRLASVEGLAVIQFLIDRYGEEALWNLVDRLGTARTFSQALLDTYGRTDLQIDAEWMAYAQDRYNVFSAAGLRLLAGGALGALALLAAAVWFVRRAVRLRPHPGEIGLCPEEIEEAERAADLLDPRD